MPYLITTRRPSAFAYLGAPERTARTAAATLEEARELAQIEVCRQIEGRTSAPFRRAATLPAEGGTIDQLPDGTVIEVQRVHWDELRAAARVPSTSSDGMTVAAFNAKQ